MHPLPDPLMLNPHLIIIQMVRYTGKTEKFFIVLLLFIAVGAGKVMSQPNHFTKVAEENDSGYVFQVHASAFTPDSGFMITGENIMLRVDKWGDPVWSRKMEHPAGPVDFRSIVVASDTNYLMAGALKVQNSQDPTKGILLMTNGNGDTLWMKTISDGQRHTYLNSVIKSLDNGFVVAGNSSDQSNPFQHHLVLAKLAADGSLLWSESVTLPSNDLSGISVLQHTDSSLWVSCGIFQNSQTKYYGGLLKFTDNGALLWGKRYRDTTASGGRGYDLCVSGSGVSLLSAHNKSFDQLPVLLRTDEEGWPLWAKSYHTDFGFMIYDYGPQLIRTNDGGYIMTWGDEFMGVVVRADSSGNATRLASLHLYPSDLHECAGQELFIVGNGPLLGVRKDYGDKQIGMIRMDGDSLDSSCSWSSGTITYDSIDILTDTLQLVTTQGLTPGKLQVQVAPLSLTSFTGCVDRLGGMEEMEPDQLLHIYPNPANDRVFIELNEWEITGSSLLLKLYDVKGNIILNRAARIENGRIVFSVSALDPGIYLLELVSENEQQLNGKLIIAH